jgi:hypothetical protein
MPRPAKRLLWIVLNFRHLFNEGRREQNIINKVEASGRKVNSRKPASSTITWSFLLGTDAKEGLMEIARGRIILWVWSWIAPLSGHQVDQAFLLPASGFESFKVG